MAKLARLTNVGAAALVAIAIGSAAQATPFDFTYTFSANRVLAGSLEGDLQLDADTIFVSSFGPVTFDGVALPSIEASDIRSVSDFPVGALQPLVSLSGSVMDVFVCASGFSGTGNCSFDSEGGFALSTDSTGAGDGQGNSQFESDFLAARWQIAGAAVGVPEPGALALLGVGLAGLFLWRRPARA